MRGFRIRVRGLILLEVRPGNRLAVKMSAPHRNGRGGVFWCLHPKIYWKFDRAGTIFGIAGQAGRSHRNRAGCFGPHDSPGGHYAVKNPVGGVELQDMSGQDFAIFTLHSRRLLISAWAVSLWRHGQRPFIRSSNTVGIHGIGSMHLALHRQNKTAFASCAVAALPE